MYENWENSISVSNRLLSLQLLSVCHTVWRLGECLWAFNLNFSEELYIGPTVPQLASTLLIQVHVSQVILT